MLETDIKKLTTAIQELAAAIQGGSTISPATTANVVQAVDNLAVTQQAQMDAVPVAPVPVPVAPVPVAPVPVAPVPVAPVPVAPVPVAPVPVAPVPVAPVPVAPVPVAPVPVAPVPGALTQEIVVKHLTDAMARLGPEGQTKVVGALSANFGTHKVPEIQPAQWPQVIAVVQQIV